MKNTIKQLLREALGVPENLTKVGIQVYGELLEYFRQQPSDASIFAIKKKTTLRGEYKIGDVAFSKIKLEIKLNTIQKPDPSLPVVYGMSVRNKSVFDPDKFINVLTPKEGETKLFINIAVSPTTTVGDVLAAMEKEQPKLTMAITHELKHAFDITKIKSRSIQSDSEYRVYTQIQTQIPPLDEFIHDLYYMTEIEYAVRATEVASYIEQLDITKKQFLGFLKTNDTYNKLKKINSFSLEGLINDLRPYIERIENILDDAGYNVPPTEDGVISLLLKVTFDLIRSHKIRSFQTSARLNDPFISMFLQMNRVAIKQIEKYQENLDKFDSYQQFFKYEEKRFKYFSDKMLKKIHKLYALAKDDEQSDVMSKINARATNESILDWDMYYEANGIGKKNPFKKDETTD